jgi:site-specific recombinase XerD
MNETGFRRFLKRSGKKEHVIDALVSQVQAFETFLLEKSQAGLKSASEADLREYICTLPERGSRIYP